MRKERLWDEFGLKDVYARLINYEHNKEFLKYFPHVKFLDLAINFYALWNDGDCDNRYLISSECQAYKGWSLGDLVMNGLSNSKSKYYVSTLDNELNRLTGHDVYLDNYYTACVIGSTSFIYGAIQMLNHVAMDEVVRMIYGENNDGNLIIIPSSVHELLVIPEIPLSYVQIDQMINKVNDSVVMGDEVLSNHAYLWNSVKRCVEIIK